jgi:hypothetical protein
MINDLRTVVSLPEPEYLLDTTSDFDSKPTYGIPDLLKLVIPDGSLESDTTTGFISEGVAGTELVGLLD